MALNVFSQTFRSASVVNGILTITKPSSAYVCLYATLMPSGAATIPSIGIENKSSTEIYVNVGEVPDGVNTIVITYK